MIPVPGRSQTPELVDALTEPRHGKVVIEMGGQDGNA
jgi:hypothetical protein